MINEASKIRILKFSNSFFSKLVQWKIEHYSTEATICKASADPEGGQGVRTPPGKSQVIWVSIGNKQLDPPGKKLDPLHEKVGPPLEPLKMIDFFEIDHLTSVK